MDIQLAESIPVQINGYSADTIHPYLLSPIATLLHSVSAKGLTLLHSVLSAKGLTLLHSVLSAKGRMDKGK